MALSACLSGLVFIPVILGTVDRQHQVILSIATAALLCWLLFLWRSRLPHKILSAGVVMSFAAVGFTGHATVGFLGAPAVACAISVVFAALLLGRRAMLVTLFLVAAGVATIGLLMTQDVLPAPPIGEISPSLGRNWLRSSSISLVLIAILVSVILWVVEAVESQHRQAESESRQRRKAELEMLRAQSVELVGRLAASLAHDVNNQLTVIAAWSAGISEGGKAVDLIQTRAEIDAAVSQAATLTRRLLMLGRRDLVQPCPIDLAAFLRDSEDTLRTLLRPDIQLTVNARTDAWCSMDRAQLQQIVLNLAINAQDALPDGGEVSVTVATRDSAASVGRTGEIPGGLWVVLSVSDTGVGMTEEVRTRAFEPFFTTKEIGRGSGLGLAAIAAIVEQAGGHIALESQPARGTRVEIWLPPVEDNAVEASEASPADVRLDGIRVLLVDDTETVLATSEKSLVASGALVVRAIDGDQAIEQLHSSDFDVLCSDVVMPGTPVSEVINAFRSVHPGGAVLLCSAYVDEEKLRNQIESGQYSFLPKPFTPRALTAAIATVLRRP